MSTEQVSSATRAVGIDVGGTKVAIGVVSAAGQLLAYDRLEVAASPDCASLLGEAAARAQDLTSTLGERDLGVGVGMPELVDLTGEILTSSVISWTRRDLVAALGAFGPVLILPDVRAAALAEARFGAGRNWSSFVYVTIGTGISYSFVQDGQPYAGAHGAAQLLGSGQLMLRCPHCGVQSRSPGLEAYAAGTALIERFWKLTGRQVRKVEEIFAAMESGDSIAAEVLNESAKAIGSYVGFLVGLLDPLGVVIGGGLGLAGGQYWDRLVASTREHIWAEYMRSIPIEPAALGVRAGVIGAGYAAITSGQLETTGRPSCISDDKKGTKGMRLGRAQTRSNTGARPKIRGRSQAGRPEGTMSIGCSHSLTGPYGMRDFWLVSGWPKAGHHCLGELDDIDASARSPKE